MNKLYFLDNFMNLVPMINVREALGTYSLDIVNIFCKVLMIDGCKGI